MAFYQPLLILISLSVTLSTATLQPFLLTVVNNCPFTIWPAIQPNSGHPILENGGFCLPALSHRSFPAPITPWSGRIWARTHCYTSPSHHFSCATGDCGTGKLECMGNGGAPPATLAQFTLHHGPNDLSSYAVSLVDGFNVPMTVTPHEGNGVCPVVGCKGDLLATCPRVLQVRASRGYVVGCKSACEAFGKDEFCCRGHFNSPQTCKPSGYSEFFKSACPSTFTYAHDTPSLTHECSAPRELKVIFCH
ncbi:Thaumatin [Heracleum sosnowskyi]|uniref:Thaumatin n=1 Tax=Heracleum sosnowskyi TaxID=360622 RepID=A0AAD8J9W2_9APIA|nr:Thaumatin [Heracleum sosnowskyi]